MISESVRPAGRLASALFGGLLLSQTAFGEGKFTVPTSGQALAAGDRVELRWAGTCADGRATEAELMLSLDGGLTFPIRLTPEMAACARGFRWQVPAVESAHARLALRAGSGEQSADERLEIVSDEFTIVAAEDDEADDLVAGPREVWTRQALDGDGTEQLPSESLAGAGDRLVRPDSSTDVDQPSPSGLGTQRASAFALPGGGRARPAAPSPRATPPSAASLPLRL